MKAVAARLIRPAMLTMAALLLLSLFSGEIRDTDIWLHLKTGQHTLETRALTVPDPFSYTSAMGAAKYAYFNLTHEWLAQIVMYVVYRGAGFPGLVLARTMLLMLFCSLVGLIAYRRSGSFYMSVAAGLAAAAMAFHFQQSRPFLATLVGLAITMAILESRGPFISALPLVFLVWANCHGGFFVGWLMLAAYCGEALILRRKERRLWVVAVASILISGLNPNGFRVIPVLLDYRSSGIQSTILEWQRPMFWEPGIYSFLLFGSLLTMLAAWRRTRPVDWLLCLGVGCISLMAVRNTIFMGLVGPVLLATYVPKWRMAPVAAVLAMATALIVYDVAPSIKAGNVFAMRAAEWQLPVGAADFIGAHQIGDHMFNPYESGGYLVWRLWPLQRDFIDPRGLSEQAYADYTRILSNSGAAGLLRKYGIQMLVLDGFDYLFGQVYPLAMEIAKPEQPEWKLVFANSDGFVFMLHPPAGVTILNSAALFGSLAAQCEQHIRHDPARPRCARGLSEFYAASGRAAQGRQWMSYYLAHRTESDPEAERIYASMNVTALNDEALALQSKGDLIAAEALLRQAVASAEKSLGPDHPDTAGSLNNLASLLESKGDYGGAEPLYRRSLAIAEKTLGPEDGRTAAALDNLAGLLAEEGQYAEAEPLFRRALTIAQKALGPDHPTTQAIRDDLAGLLTRK